MGVSLFEINVLAMYQAGKLTAYDFAALYCSYVFCK